MSSVVFLPVDQVTVGSRQRSNDEATQKHIRQLADDIAENGLIHAPQVDQNGTLIAGWCRLNAIKLLNAPYFYAGAEVGAGFLPVTRTHKTEEKDLHRIELMENLRRKNLSPLDEAKAIAKLHGFMQETQGENWTREDTGKTLDSLRGALPRERAARTSEVSDALLLAPFEHDAEVAKATTRKEAVSIARKKLEQSLVAALGDLHVHSSDEYQILEGDCREILPTLERGSFSGIICDPPYGIDADDFGDQAMKTGHDYEDTYELAISIAESIFTEGYRVCGDNAHLYMFCDIGAFENLADLARDRGWQVFTTPLIWHKPNIGHAPWPGYFSRRYEGILFAQKGSRQLQRSRSDIFEYSAVTTGKLHAAQKPVDLIRELLTLSFFPGERILDPTAGSGTIFRAARMAKVLATGIELKPQSIAFCKSAIAEE